MAVPKSLSGSQDTACTQVYSFCLSVLSAQLASTQVLMHVVIPSAQKMRFSGLYCLHKWVLACEVGNSSLPYLLCSRPGLGSVGCQKSKLVLPSSSLQGSGCRVPQLNASKCFILFQAVQSLWPSERRLNLTRMISTLDSPDQTRHQ